MNRSITVQTLNKKNKHHVTKPHLFEQPGRPAAALRHLRIGHAPTGACPLEAGPAGGL